MHWHLFGGYTKTAWRHFANYLPVDLQQSRCLKQQQRWQSLHTDSTAAEVIYTVQYSTVQAKLPKLTYEYEEGGQEEDDPQYCDDFYVLESLHLAIIVSYLARIVPHTVNISVRDESLILEVWWTQPIWKH